MESMPPVPKPEPRSERTGCAPAPAAVIPLEDQQETDVWWGGYASRTMLPSFILCVLVTGGVAALWLGWLEYQVSVLQARYSAYAVIGTLWLFQLGRWLYRILTRTYRLTTRRLFLERTFFHVPARIVDLREVIEVTVEWSAWERKLHVGRLHLRTVNSHLPVLTLEGVYDPERIAARIRDLAKQKYDPDQTGERGALTPR